MIINLGFEIDTATDSAESIRNIFNGFGDVLSDTKVTAPPASNVVPLKAVETKPAPAAEVKPAPATEVKPAAKKVTKVAVVKTEDTSSVIPERDIVIQETVEPVPETVEPETTAEPVNAVAELTDADVERLTALRQAVQAEAKAWSAANGAAKEAVGLLSSFGTTMFSAIPLERVEEFKAAFDNLKATFVKK